MNILVTGASKGIGRVIAQELKSARHKVFVSARNEQALKELKPAGYLLCDLANEYELAKLGDFIAENKIDVLINNAGEYIYSDPPYYSYESRLRRLHKFCTKKGCPCSNCKFALKRNCKIYLLP